MVSRLFQPIKEKEPHFLLGQARSTWKAHLIWPDLCNSTSIKYTRRAREGSKRIQDNFIKGQAFHFGGLGFIADDSGRLHAHEDTPYRTPDSMHALSPAVGVKAAPT